MKLAVLNCLLACLLTCPVARAHPLQAEPIKHPYVFTFDQFHIPEDPDEALIDGGLLLMAEARCTACHAAPAAWAERLAASPGPDLSQVGSRLDADTLWLFIRSPSHRKVGTLMPGLFNAADEDSPAKVEALTQYLLTLRKAPAPQSAASPGNPERGRQLYHTTGCVACHQPATDYQPTLLPPSGVAEKPGNASVPLVFAEAYDLASLTAFLLDPLSFRPAGRMPSHRLTPAEAADIAAYLHVGRTVDKALERELLRIPPQTAELGRRLFSEQRCSSCHSTGENLAQHLARPLADLRADSPASCLADDIAPGTPRYGFNDFQLRALRLALSHLQEHAEPAPRSAAERLDWQMLRLNCYACHDRDGKGGPEEARAAYFSRTRIAQPAIGDAAHLPPSLDHIGWKLTQPWLHNMLGLKPQSPALLRDHLTVRMPSYGQTHAALLAKLFTEADVAPADKAQQPSPGASVVKGQALFHDPALACATCHRFGGTSPLEQPTTDLAPTSQRLQPLYFQTLLHDPASLLIGTSMPQPFKDRPNANEEIESLWLYLQSRAAR